MQRRGALLKQEERSTTEQHHARHSGTTQQATGCELDKEHASVASQCGMEPRPENNHGQTKAGL